MGMMAGASFIYALDRKLISLFCAPPIVILLWIFIQHYPQHTFLFCTLLVSFVVSIYSSSASFYAMFRANLANSRRNQVLAEEVLYSHTKMQNHLANTPIGYLEVDAQNLVQFANPAAATILGYEKSSDLHHLLAYNFVEHSRDNQENLVEVYEHIWNNGQSYQCTMDSYTQQGKRVWCDWYIVPTFSDQKIVGTALYFTDVTERIENAEHIKTIAYIDSLTGLPNRRQLVNALEEEINQPSQHSTALLYIDLDNFKDINDSRGHGYGDIVLQQFSDRLMRLVDQNNIVARIGGDEFAIFLRSIKGDGGSAKLYISELSERIISSCTEAYTIDNEQFHCEVSIGIAMISANTNSANDVLQHADLALYHVKRGGKFGYYFHDASLTEHAEQHIRLLQALRSGLTNNNIKPFYQPLLTVATQQCIGAEVLMRWHEDNGQTKEAQQFINTLESSSFMLKITQSLLGDVCAQLAHWRQQGQWSDCMRIFLNLSVTELSNPLLINVFEHTLLRYGTPASLFEIEVTERGFVDSPTVKEQIAQLRQMGMSIAIDDFGTGYSSMAYLKNFDIDTLKIDRLFISQIADNERERSFVEAILHICKAIGVKSVAEGVETQQQLAVVQELKLDYYQGYAIAKPMPGQAFTEYLNNI